jgi:hypothetical protein
MNEIIDEKEYYKPKVFPIQNDAACVLKWSWVTYYMSMDQVNMCHRTGGFHMDGMRFKDFNKHPNLVEERERMKNNQWPEKSCRYCKSVEDVGSTSERQVFTKQVQWTPWEIQNSKNDDDIPLEVTPRIMEVYFRNACNLACTYCSPMFSSKIATELKKFGPISDKYGLDGAYKETDNYQARKEEFWEYMQEHSHKISYFHILGGEPFYQREFEECLDFLQQKDHPNLVIKVFSNLSHTPRKFEQKIKLIRDLISQNRLKGFEIVCSIDAWGPEQEIARYGIDLKQWKRNFDVLVNEPKITMSVHSTLCPLTLPTAYQLTEIVNDARKIKPSITHSWNIIADPVFLDPTIFGKYMRTDFNKLIDVIPDFLSDTRKVVEGFRDKVVANDISTEKNKELMKEFYDYMEEICRRRNLDWRSVYPKLVSILIAEGVINE